MKKIKALTFLFAILIATSMYAQPVTLDPTFGKDGITEIPNPKYYYLLDFDKSGNIISSGISDDGEIKIAKMNMDGIIDKNFGINGEIILSSGYIIYNLNLKVTTDNKILLDGVHGKDGHIVTINGDFQIVDVQSHTSNLKPHTAYLTPHQHLTYQFRYLFR